MAYVKNNIVTDGLSGKLGNTIVFRQWGGKTVVAVKPTYRKREPTEAQKEHHRKFRQGSRYARQAIQDPNLKATYQQRARGGQSAYNVAMADFMNLPDITEMDLGTYTGAKGHAITIMAEDDHLVADVQVAIYNRAGNLLEQGPAELHDNGVDWTYTTQKANGQPKGTKLVVQVSDLPGNTTTKEEVLA